MNLIEALQKYKQVTNDGGKTIYSTNNIGQIVRCANNLVSTVNPTIDLLSSTGWEEYTKLTLLNRYHGKAYFYINEFGEVNSGGDLGSSVDNDLAGLYNYFDSESFAQYVADKQFIQRVYLTLVHINKDLPDKEDKISVYIKENYKEVIDRIRKYKED